MFSDSSKICAGSVVARFSHLRWKFVFQRPQHSMSRFARTNRVLFWAEPLWEDVTEPRVDASTCAATGVVVLTPVLPVGLDHVDGALAALLNAALVAERGPIIRWYYTPMMLPFSEHTPAHCVVYDSMDELSGFQNAPSGLLALETRLFAEADLVFNGDHSPFEAKRDRHPNIHPFPSIFNDRRRRCHSDLQP